MGLRSATTRDKPSATPRHRRPGRKAATVAIVLGAVVGATAAAAFKSPSEFSYTAQATVLADPADGGANASSHLREVLHLDEAVAAVQASTGNVDNVADRVTVEAAGHSGFIRIIGRDKSPQAAVALTNMNLAVGLEFAYLLQQGIVPDADVTRVLEGGKVMTLVAGDFEKEIGGWGSAPSFFAVAPARMHRVVGSARQARWSLEVVCAPVYACGATTRIRYPFQAGFTYRASAWARARSGKPNMMLVLGGSQRDFATGSPVRLTNRWKLLEATWTPRAKHGFAEVTLQKVDRAKTTFNVDAVSIVLPESPLQTGRGSRARYLVIESAVPRDRSEASTLWSAVAGSALGTGAAVLGIAFAFAASRRRR